MKNSRYCLALDLKKDAALVAEYEQWHHDVWPAIKDSIRDAGITDMEIYRLEDRLFMIMETSADFNFEKKAAMDAGNPDVQKWEELMWKYQAPVPGGQPGEKWRLMKKIFSLNQSI
ncbi:MAG TPA: L-rhamnose mutarotase [Puia sp.]